MKTLVKISAITALTLASACAPTPENVSASYVSQSTFNGSSCGNLTNQRNEIVREVNVLNGLQRQNANADAAAMGIGMLLFWPALFVVAANGDHQTELASAKGRFNAITGKMQAQGCQV